MVKLKESIHNLSAADVTGQKLVRLHDVKASCSVGEMLDGMLPRMRLHQVDHNGNPVQYEVRLEREGRHLHRSERVGDVLEEADHLVVHPRIVAGGRNT